MATYNYKHIPSAIYIDSNILRAASHDLNQPWFSELISFCNNYGISMYISKLVLDEWCEHIFEILQANISKIIASLKMLKEFHIMDLDFNENVEINRKELYERQKERLENYGFNVIQNLYIPTELLVKEAILKKPPFETGGKGFRDTIIIETYADHANKNYSDKQVIIFSNDNAVQKSRERFSSKGIKALFYTQENIIKELNDKLSAEEKSNIKERKENLLKFIKSKEAKIIEYVRTTELKINDLFLDGIGENKLNGTVRKILSVIPTKISDVLIVQRFFESETEEGRFPIMIFVNVYIELIIDEYNILSSMVEPLAFVQPQSITENSPIQIEKKYSLTPQERFVKVDRSVTIEATLDKDKADQGIFEDLQLLKLL